MNDPMENVTDEFIRANVLTTPTLIRRRLVDLAFLSQARKRLRVSLSIKDSRV